MYTVALGLIKVSLIILYLEIFVSRRARIGSYIILAYVIINTLVVVFITVFNCIPILAFWDQDVKGKCMNTNALEYANSASAVIQDAVLIVFPLVCLRSLNMERKRKIAVGFMFAVGALYASTHPPFIPQTN